ncbi:MAG: aspartate 4-decarboxylase [Clostridium sp.]|jgi:aspartate 4-decarboxylase
MNAVISIKSFHRYTIVNHFTKKFNSATSQMAIFSLFAIVDKENRYKKLTKNICRRRKKLLFEGLGIELPIDPFDESYSKIG